MPTESEQLKISVNERESVTALLYAAAKRERAGITILLGHGAGANQLSSFMCLFAKGLAARGLDVMTFNFLYSEQGRRSPDPKSRLESTYRGVIAAASQNKTLKGNRLVIGGKSMGGRIASQVAAAYWAQLETVSNEQARSRKDDLGNDGHGLDIIEGLVFLGYPLHPPGKPDQLRDKHLKDIRARMLFVQGTRDSFGTADELQDVIKRLHLPATLHLIQGGDHSFKVPKTAPLSQERVYESIMDEIARWLKPTGKE